jgi:hypothetical protein
MTESVIVNEWMAQAAAKAKIEDVLLILNDKFADVPADLRAKVEATTALDALLRWVLLAATADSLEGFRQRAGL